MLIKEATSSSSGNETMGETEDDNDQIMQRLGGSRSKLKTLVRLTKTWPVSVKA